MVENAAFEPRVAQDVFAWLSPIEKAKQLEHFFLLGLSEKSLRTDQGDHLTNPLYTPKLVTWGVYAVRVVTSVATSWSPLNKWFICNNLQTPADHVDHI